jgi:hypothetical protein
MTPQTTLMGILEEKEVYYESVEVLPTAPKI